MMMPPPPQFVIVAAFDHTDPSLPVEERVALGVKRCGVSVTCEMTQREGGGIVVRPVFVLN